MYLFVAGVPTSCRNQSQANGMPELEAYMRLDCSQSNVSPDSGIQSVAGSPAGHHSLPGSPRSPTPAQNSGPPLLTKAHSPCPLQDTVPSPNVSNTLRSIHNDLDVGSAYHDSMYSLMHFGLLLQDKITKLVSPPKELKLENGGKRGPGRPKHVFVLNTFGRKKRGKRLKRPDVPKKPIVLPPSAAELKVPPFFAGAKQGKSNLPSLPHVSSKRGRGRPKKSPPVLEPILPLERKRDASDSSRKCSSLERIPSSERSTTKSNLFSKISLKKEHKHKKRKRQSLDFRKLDPAFLRELTRLSETFEKCCVISTYEIPKIVESKHQETSSHMRKRRRKREKLRALPTESKTPSPTKESTETTKTLSSGKTTLDSTSRKKEENVVMPIEKVPSPSKKASEDRIKIKDKKDAHEVQHEVKVKVKEIPSDTLEEPPPKPTKETKTKAASNSTKERDQSVRDISPAVPKDRSQPVLREKTKDKARNDSLSQKKSQPGSPQIKDKSDRAVISKEKLGEPIQPKDKKDRRTPSPVVAKEKDVPKEKEVLKEKTTANTVTKEKVIPPQKEKTQSALAPCKEKPAAPPAHKEKPTAVAKDKASAAVVVKDKTATTPSQHDRSVGSQTKERNVVVAIAKEKKELAVQPVKALKEVTNSPSASPQSAKRRIKKTSTIETPKVRNFSF